MCSWDLPTKRWLYAVHRRRAWILCPRGRTDSRDPLPIWNLPAGTGTGKLQDSRCGAFRQLNESGRAVSMRAWDMAKRDGGDFLHGCDSWFLCGVTGFGNPNPVPEWKIPAGFQGHCLHWDHAWIFRWTGRDVHSLSLSCGNIPTRRRAIRMRRCRPGALR